MQSTQSIPYSHRSHYIVHCVVDGFDADTIAEIRTYILGFDNARFLEIRSWQGVR